MSEKKFKKFQILLQTYKNRVKPQNQKYLDEITSMYFNGKIKRIDTAENLIKKLTTNRKTAVNKLNKA